MARSLTMIGGWSKSALGPMRDSRYNDTKTFLVLLPAPFRGSMSTGFSTMVHEAILGIEWALHEEDMKTDQFF